MNRQELPRIRLKVATNAGINILCTALRTWRVVQWLPHIEQAYREVKEDQEGDEDSNQNKKGELIGDIFEDNDEVQCQILFPQIARNTKSKKEKKSEKQKEKQAQFNRNEDFDEEGSEQKQKQANDKNKTVKNKNNKTVKKFEKIEKTQEKNQSNNQKQLPKITKKGKKDIKITQKNPQINQQEEDKQPEAYSKSLKQTLMRSIDFSKLKSILNPKIDSKPQSKQSEIKVENESSDSQEQDDS